MSPWIPGGWCHHPTPGFPEYSFPPLARNWHAKKHGPLEPRQSSLPAAHHQRARPQPMKSRGMGPRPKHPRGSALAAMAGGRRGRSYGKGLAASRGAGRPGEPCRILHHQNTDCPPTTPTKAPEAGGSHMAFPPPCSLSLPCRSWTWGPFRALSPHRYFSLAQTPSCTGPSLHC